FGRPDAVPGHVQHVVDAADNPKIAVLVLAATVPGEVAALHLAPVSVAISLHVAPDAAQHARPRLANDQFAAAVPGNGFTLVIHDFRQHTEEGQRCRAGLGGR